jgi:biopolymer transport protein ExbB
MRQQFIVGEMVRLQFKHQMQYIKLREVPMMPPMSSAFNEFLSFLQHGGFIMYPLLFLAIFSLSLTVERIIFWTKTGSRKSKIQVDALVEALRAGKRDKVIQLCDGSTLPDMAVAARMVIDGSDDSVASAAAEIQRHRLERFSVILSTIITASPMIGILGTVIGIIKSFQVLGNTSGLADPRGVSGGIGEALITTASGLAVALLTLFPYMAFKGLADRGLGRMESVIAAAQIGLPRRPTRLKELDESNAALQREPAEVTS